MAGRTSSVFAAARRFRPVALSGKNAAAQVRSGEFRQVAGDGLAKALRNRWRKAGGMPEKPFVCVYSAEAPLIGEQAGRGSVMTVTAAFGLKLAELVLSDLKKSLAKAGQKMI